MSAMAIEKPGRLGESLRGYRLLFRWEILQSRQELPMLIAIQLALGVGVIYGFAFLIPDITPGVALYFVTGAPTLTMVLLGLTFIPQNVAQSRLTGRHLYVSALPLPRIAPMLASVTFFMLIQLPGAVLTLVLATLRFHVHLHISPLIIPAVLLVTLTPAALGYAMAVVLSPGTTNQIASVLSLAVLLFSPINFPIGRLPGWLQDVHHVLPIASMADLVRGSLSGTFTSSSAADFAIVGAWCVVSLVVSSRVASRRG